MPSRLLELLAHRSEAGIGEILDAGEGAVTFINPYSYMHFRRRIGELEGLDHILVDGASLRYVLNASGVSNCKRLSFDYSSIADTVFSHAKAKGIAVAIVGSEKAYLDEAVAKLGERYPGMKIAFSHEGFFESEAEVVRGLIASGAGIAVIGMGSGKQEAFLVRLREAGWKGLGFTCGGFIHQAADALDYYPLFIRKLGLRWLYRLAKEPLKVGGRLLFSYVPFFYYYFCDWCEWLLSRERPARAS